MTNLTEVERPIYTKYADFNEGDVLVEGTYSHSAEGKFGIQHYFDNMEGRTVCLNKAGMLDKFVDSSLWSGRAVKVVYGGKQPIEKGQYAGKEAQTFKFFVDKAETRNTSNLSSANPDELD